MIRNKRARHARARRLAPASGCRRSTAAYSTATAAPTASAQAEAAPALPTAHRSGRTAASPIGWPRGLRCSGCSWSINPLTGDLSRCRSRETLRRARSTTTTRRTSIHALVAIVAGPVQAEDLTLQGRTVHPGRRRVRPAFGRGRAASRTASVRRGRRRWGRSQRLCRPGCRPVGGTAGCPVCGPPGTWPGSGVERVLGHDEVISCCESGGAARRGLGFLAEWEATPRSR